jgi:hypothetical protein
MENTKQGGQKMAKEKEEKEKPQYEVKHLAAELGITEQSTRVFLRSIEEEREGRSYGWDTKAEIDALKKQYNSRKKPAAEPEPAKAKVPKAKKAA